MKAQRLSETVGKMLSLVDLYSSLANRQINNESDLQRTKEEMKSVKSSLLSMLIKSKKELKAAKNV